MYYIENIAFQQLVSIQVLTSGEDVLKRNKAILNFNIKLNFNQVSVNSSFVQNCQLTFVKPQS